MYVSLSLFKLYLIIKILLLWFCFVLGIFSLFLIKKKGLGGGGEAMTTKKGAAAIAWWRHVVIRWWSCKCKCQWKLKLLLFLSVALTLYALFTFHSTHSPPDISFSSSSSLSPSRHRLLRLQFDGVPKIAFLFLARRNLPLDFLWDSFFEVFFFFFLLFYFMNVWIFLCLTLGFVEICRMLTWRTSRSMFTRPPGSSSMSPHRGPLSFAIDNWRIAFRSFFFFLNCFNSFSMFLNFVQFLASVWLLRKPRNENENNKRNFITFRFCRVVFFNIIISLG